MQTQTVEIKIEIQAERICNLVVSALECGYSPWLGTFTPIEHDKPTEGIWYGDPIIYNDRLKVKVTYDDPNEGEGSFTGSKELLFVDLTRALKLMAEKHPRHFGDMIAENDDAITADVYMQLVILGDVVYG